MAIEAKLIVIEGATEAEISLKLPTVVGRSGEAALKVRTSVVSRKHCRLYEKNGTLFVEDLNSSNGTFVNEEKIANATKIGTGDFLTVGPVTLEVVCKNDGRSIAHDPYTGDCGVLNECPQPETESPSNVRYQETIEGSFLGIDDSMPLNPAPHKVVGKSAEPEFDRLKLSSKKKTTKPGKSKKKNFRKNNQSANKEETEERGHALDNFLKKNT
ncbi:MAG: FHA domain-containing protein [Planctomycetales bacterium]